jgi:hypothetical protein
MPTTSVPPSYQVTNPGKESLSLAGLVTIHAGKTVTVDLRKFRPESNATAVLMALRSAIDRGHIQSTANVDNPIDVLVPDQMGGQRTVDTVQGGVSRNRPSTGLGGAGNNAKSEVASANSAIAKTPLPSSNHLEAIPRSMDQIHNPSEPALNMGSEPAAPVPVLVDADSPPVPPAPPAPPAIPLADSPSPLALSAL